MHTARTLFAVCIACFLNPAAYAAQAPKNALEAARGAVLVGCLDYVEYAQPLEKVAGQLALTPAAEPELLELARGEKAWSVGSPEGRVVIISHGGPWRPCSVYVFGAAGDAIKADLNVWLTQGGGPFTEEAIAKNSPPGSTGYRWERGDIDISVVLSVNTVNDRPGAPTFAASIFLTK